ncbi:MAG TPA: hypothetical protein VEC57_06405 [Candidatus Limnocylindrales bacterium]|nr:hypothetical protein [Candidatus Limnocylindrales bacterium]
MTAASGRGARIAASRHARRCAAAALSAAILSAAPASAVEMRVTSPNQVCSPNANPCDISSNVIIDSPTDLDFGLRTVRVLAGAKIRFKRAGILCGAFLVEGPASRIGLQVLDEEEAGSLKITARRSCSGAPNVPCLEDSQCAGHGPAACTGGSGVIRLDARLDGDHNRGTDVLLRAADSVAIHAVVSLNGSGKEGDAGELTIDALQGDVLIDGPVNIRQSLPQGNYYGRPFPPGYAGYLTIDAERDVLFQRQVDLTGHFNGGEVHVQAGRDIIVGHNVLRDGINGTYSSDGGDGSFQAGRDMKVQPHGPTDDLTFLSANGGHYFYNYPGYGGYGGFEAGRGGYTRISTGRDFRIEQKAVVSADTARDDCQDGVPYAGEFDVYASGGFEIDGLFSVTASGRCGVGGDIYLNAYGDGAVGPTGKVTATAVRAGDVQLRTEGNFFIDGEMSVRADRLEDYYGVYGEGGELYAEGDDVAIAGKVRGGGPEGGWGVNVGGCRVRLEPTASITAEYSYTSLDFQESFIAEAGSKITATEGSNHINGTSKSEPPVLLGEIEPPPQIAYGAWHASNCPPCGNGRIEPGETCDDGNVTDGDGCSAGCVNEGCIAHTAGYPGTALCDDGTECTTDRCDALTSTCVHEAGCADDLSCTVETCEGDSCDVTPVDAACDDGNACTTDLCNADTGCVHGTLVDGECNDGDICTAASSCDADARCTSDETRAATGGVITISPREDSSDRLVGRFRLQPDALRQSITVTGLTAALFDSDGTVYFHETIPAVFFDPSEDEEQAWLAATTVGDVRIRARVALEDDGSATVRLSIRRSGLYAAAAAGELGMSLLFGSEPATDDCHTFVPAPCRSLSKIVCRQ